MLDRWGFWGVAKEAAPILLDTVFNFGPGTRHCGLS